MIFHPARATIAVLILASCTSEEWPTPLPVSWEQFAADHEEWRQYREGRLVTPPGGSVLWVGLYLVPQGTSQFGSNPTLPIVLPDVDAPPLAGTLHRSGQEIRLEPAPGSRLRIHEGEWVTEPIVLNSDRSGDPTRLALGSLGMRIHGEPGTDRLWLRVWDEDLPKRETFTLPDYYPVDPDWRHTARFEPYEETLGLRSPDVTGGIVVQQAPGELVFRRDGQEHRMIAIAGPNSTSYFIMMWDSTATTETYQAGRYLRVPVVDSTGWTTIDFNRTYNAPCVFTAHSVCALPPRENWLPFPVTAGEKRPAEPPY